MAKTKKEKLYKKIEDRVEKFRSSSYFYPTLILLVLLGLFYLGRSLLIAAVVDGKPITRLEVIRELEKQSGQETLDNLISKVLLFQEAQRRGVQISDQAIQAEIDNISSVVEAQGTTLDAELILRGQTREELEENVRIQKTIDELLAGEVGISDEEMENYFEENQAFFGEEAVYDDLKEDIREQLRQEKISQEFSSLLQTLRSESNIYYLVDY